ncbi:MAG: hypothetical protein RJA99_283 [Pseudomonadota bacterium]|jgi:uncharacterized protein (DUF1800 family)
MTFHPARRRAVAALAAAPLLAAGCAGPSPEPVPEPAARAAPLPAAEAVALLDRLAWGASPSSLRRLTELGEARWLAEQLRPPATTPLPDEVAARIAAMTLSQRPITELVPELDRERRAADALADDAAKNAARQAYQQSLTRLAREAASRSLLLAVHSPWGLRERMTWFWTNHFSVFQGKAELRALVGDYQDRAIRPHALGRFRDLLGAATKHPAMLRYLDNAQNAAGRLNENHARELLELHTLGVDGGYGQADVQELARVMTGVGISYAPGAPRMRTELQRFHVRDGVFEFNPARHDWGDKRVLGRTIPGVGLDELETVLDDLARHPSTARFVCGKLARFLVGGPPDPALVARLARTFARTDGDVAATVADLVATPAFRASLGTRFKDPQTWVVSSVRLAFDARPVVDAAPMLGWLARLGQSPFGRQTPDGWSLDETAWSGSGQLTARFEVARAIVGAGPALYRPAEAAPTAARLDDPFFVRAVTGRLAPATREVLDGAASPAERLAFLLSSPEFMRG